MAALGSAAAFLWFASFAFFRDTMFGPLPSASSIALIWHTMVEGVRLSQTDAAPVPATVSFLCLSAFAVWATAWLADDAAVKLRHPMLAIAVTIPLFVLPGTIVEGSHRWVDVAPYLAAAMLVLFQDERFRLARWGKVVGSGVPGWRPGLAARLGLVAVVVALVGTPILPGFSAPPGLQGINGNGDQVRLNPLVSIRPQLSDHGTVDVFTVQSGVAAYWRLTALDTFDGTLWTSGAQRPTLKIGSKQLRCNQRRDEPRLLGGKQLQRLVGEERPVLDGVDARAERVHDPFRADGVRGDPDAGTVRLVDRGGELLCRVRGSLRADPRGQHAAGRHDLDPVRAFFDQAAHRLDELGGGVHLPADEVPVPARDREDRRGGEDARAGGDPLALRARDLEHHELEPAEIPDGRDSGLERAARVSCGLERCGRRRHLALFAQEVGAPVEAEMDVTVDEPGDEGQAVQLVDLIVVFGLRACAGPGARVDDPVALGAQGRGGDRVRAEPVEEAGAAQDETSHMSSLQDVG